jgi:hypothetical protein
MADLYNKTLSNNKKEWMLTQATTRMNFKSIVHSAYSCAYLCKRHKGRISQKLQIGGSQDVGTRVKRRHGNGVIGMREPYFEGHLSV